MISRGFEINPTFSVSKTPSLNRTVSVDCNQLHSEEGDMDAMKNGWDELVLDCKSQFLFDQ